MIPNNDQQIVKFNLSDFEIGEKYANYQMVIYQ